MITHNAICLICRKSGNGLCGHRRILCREAHAPRFSAGRPRWEKFVEFLNVQVGRGAVFYADDMSRVNTHLSLDTRTDLRKLS